MLFRVKSEKSYSFDAKVRTFCEDVNVAHNFEETDECLKMNHWKFEQLNRDEVAKHFGVFDSYLYKKSNDSSKPVHNVWIGNDEVKTRRLKSKSGN
jgi:hypothetical protein